MQEIAQSIQRVADIMSEITAASVEQTSGIEQINQAITQMDQVTQQNAALVEEAVTASGAMQKQAAALAQAVAVFKLGGSQQAAPRGVAPKAMPSPGGGSRAVEAAPRQAAPIQRLAVAQGSSDDEWAQF